MNLPEHYKAIGIFKRTHALKGELNASLEVEDEYLIQSQWIIVEIEGIPTPFYIESIRPKGATTSLLKLKSIDDEQQAQKFVNHTIFTDADVLTHWLAEDSEGMYASDFKGFTLFDEDGNTLGVIEDVNLNSEMNPLFEVLSTEGKSLLVPVADDLIQSYDTEAQTITMSIPQGLLEI